jgi:catechol 2,3-dioxygenase-like lactoylglutathione lyase family enzyme
MSARPHSIHHVNIPIKDPERTKEWYGNVFGLQAFSPRFQGGVPGITEGHILLTSRGNFGVHFTIHDDPPDIRPHHFAVELEDWDGFVAHLDALGIKYSNYNERPQNGAKSAYIYDPDQNIVEIMFHPQWNHESPIQPD